MARPAPMACSGSRTSTGRLHQRHGTSSGRHAAANFVPTIFVSPEDVVWQEATNPNNVYTIGGVPGRTPWARPSPVVPDLSITHDRSGWPDSPTNDWRFSWMITAQQNNSSNGAVVRRQHRRLREPAVLDRRDLDGGDHRFRRRRDRGRGYLRRQRSKTSCPLRARPGYGAGADRTVLLRWFGQPSPTPSSRSAISSPT